MYIKVNNLTLIAIVNCIEKKNEQLNEVCDQSWH